MEDMIEKGEETAKTRSRPKKAAPPGPGLARQPSVVISAIKAALTEKDVRKSLLVATLAAGARFGSLS